MRSYFIPRSQELLISLIRYFKIRGVFMKKIITISRQFGAGGGTLGYKLARELNYECYDKEIILTAARNSNLDVKSFVEWDEKVPINFGFTQSLFDFYNKPLSEQIFNAQKEVIRKAAGKGSCVIIGRNANSILKEYESCINIFIYADFEWRLERMKAKMPKEPENKVIEHIKSVDKAREKYCTYHTKTVFGDAKYYDMCLSTSKFGIDKCIEIIKSAL